MDRSEWNNSTDSSADYESQTDQQAEELVLKQPMPLLEQLIRRVDLPEQRQDSYRPTTEEMIDKVTEVSKYNQTNERLLERRHEVKDFAASKNQKTQISSQLADILNPTSEKYIYYSQSPHTTSHAPKTTLIFKLVHDKTLYGYAVRYGFISGVLALLVATLFVTLFT